MKLDVSILLALGQIIVMICKLLCLKGTSCIFISEASVRAQHTQSSQVIINNTLQKGSRNVPQRDRDASVEGDLESEGQSTELLSFV